MGKPLGPRSAWYPVSEDTPCLHESTQCRNDQGKKFECAAGDRCCGGACVAHGDACCENVLGNHFPCQRNNEGEGGCCCILRAVQEGFSRKHTSTLFQRCMQ